MIKTLSKIYQFSGKMQGTMKKAILFSVLHSLFDMMSFGAFDKAAWHLCRFHWYSQESDWMEIKIAMGRRRQ